MDKSYNLNLPDWGPYNRQYLGAAHVADKEKGLRFDFNLFPGYFRRNVMLTKDIADSGVKMMSASKKLSRFVYRYELEWKDKVYVEADFRSDNNVMTVKCNFINNTDMPETLSINAVMSMKGTTLYHKEIVPCYAYPKDGIWIDALDYDKISTLQKIASDGLYLCEKRESGFVGGSFVDLRQFDKSTDGLEYNFSSVLCDKIGIRYRGEGWITVKLSSDEYSVFLPFSDEITMHYVDIKKGEYSSICIYTEGCEVDFDGILMGTDVDFFENTQYFIPECENVDNGIKIRFKDKEYTVLTDCDNYVVRRFKTDDVGLLLATHIHNHTETRFGDDGREHIDLFIRPIFVDAHSEKTITFTIIAPKSDEFTPDYELVEPVCNRSGEKYKLSQKIMSAVTLTNVIWPVYSRRGYILHNTPGRVWDCLYTWDSGFIGMGLSELDIGRATDCLNTYMTPVGDIHSPYILHGSPVPTQIFLYAEIFLKTGDAEFLEKFYPMIHQQYRFFANMRKKQNAKKTGMFALWDIFYNSGGWDDYPAQKYIHENNMQEDVCPVISASMTVLCGKILKNFAQVLNKDTAEFDEDIEFYSKAINEYAWDEQSGYYGYVKNDGSILKINGVNADMGMDGAFPFVAGISDEAKSARIVENIKNGMMTPIGVSAVDTRAPYYRNGGYWNGSIWMPHQWILWKACLDNGKSDFARQIAETALNLWEKETSYTYNCYEHFIIANERGGGFHQFSGLSTPVLMWFSSYYRPYTVTSGFMTVITDKKITEDKFAFCVKSVSKKPVVLICMPEDKEYILKTSGKVSYSCGVYTVEFNAPVSEKIEVLTKD